MSLFDAEYTSGSFNIGFYAYDTSRTPAVKNINTLYGVNDRAEYCNIVTAETSIDGYANVFYQMSGTVSGKVYNFLLLDLTTLFPTDPDFVNSLKQSDAIKVAHRLGLAAFTLD